MLIFCYSILQNYLTCHHSNFRGKEKRMLENSRETEICLFYQSKVQN